MARLLEGHTGVWGEPGTGKTLPAVRAGALLGLPQLWVTHAELRQQAARVLQAERDDRPRIQVITSGRDIVDPQADAVVVSYDLMRDLKIWRQLFGLSWGSIVCDEAHALKNTGSVRTRAFYGAQLGSKGALYRRSPNVWLLTGTPILNNPADLWPHVSRLWPEWLPEPHTKAKWIEEYCIERQTHYGMQIVGARNTDRLNEMLRAVGTFQRLELDQRLDLDEIEVEFTPADLREIEAASTPQQWAEVEALFAGHEEADADDRAHMQLEARMLPLTKARRVLGLIKARSIAKQAALELDGGLGQIIVWGHHVEALQHCAAALRGYGCGLLSGGTPRALRESMVREFTQGRLRALVASAAVAGTGLDGLQCCHRAILLEPAWVPGSNTQTIRRLYRIGQRHPVHVSFATAPGFAPDEAINRTLIRKAALIAAITETDHAHV